MTTKTFSGDRMGRNPFNTKADAKATKFRAEALKADRSAERASESLNSAETTSANARSHHSASTGILQRLFIELPIHLVFMGLKSISVFREVVRSTQSG